MWPLEEVHAMEWQIEKAALEADSAHEEESRLAGLVKMVPAEIRQRVPLTGLKEVNQVPENSFSHRDWLLALVSNTKQAHIDQLRQVLVGPLVLSLGGEGDSTEIVRQLHSHGTYLSNQTEVMAAIHNVDYARAEDGDVAAALEYLRVLQRRTLREQVADKQAAAALWARAVSFALIGQPRTWRKLLSS